MGFYISCKAGWQGLRNSFFKGFTFSGLGFSGSGLRIYGFRVQGARGFLGPAGLGFIGFREFRRM